MAYFSISKKPTKEKKLLYKFMEKHKTQGIVSGRKFAKYIGKKEFSLENVRYVPKTGRIFDIYNKRRHEIGTASVKHKVINWWAID